MLVWEKSELLSHLCLTVIQLTTDDVGRMDMPMWHSCNCGK
jgi:hypothetical protein